jgi:steroid delta-isomerase-like uncharacterized protein
MHSLRQERGLTSRASKEQRAMNRFLFVMLAGLILTGATLRGGSADKQNENNKDVAIKVFSEIYGAGKLNLINELFADDFVDDSPGGGRGRAFVKTAVSDFRTAFPDLRFELQDVFATEDKVVVRYAASGTQTGPFGQFLPSGKQVYVRGITIFQVKEGKIKTEWTEYDQLGLMRQISMIP